MKTWPIESKPHAPAKKWIQNVNSEKCFPQHTVKFNHNNSHRHTLQKYQMQNSDFLTACVDLTIRSLSHYLLKDRGRVRPLGPGRMCHHRRHVWGCFLRRCYHLEARRASTVTLSAVIPVRHALMQWYVCIYMFYTFHPVLYIIIINWFALLLIMNNDEEPFSTRKYSDLIQSD